MDVLLADDYYVRQILLANDVLRSLIIKELISTEKVNLEDISGYAQRNIKSSDAILQRIRQSPLHRAVAVNSSIDFACRHIAETEKVVVDQNQLIESFTGQGIYVRADDLSLKEIEKISQDIKELFFPFRKTAFKERLLFLSPQEIELRHAQSSRKIFTLITYHPTLYNSAILAGVEALSVGGFQNKLDSEMALESLIERVELPSHHSERLGSSISSYIVGKETASDKFGSDKHHINKNNLEVNFFVEEDLWSQTRSNHQDDFQVLLTVVDEESERRDAECIAISSMVSRFYYALFGRLVNSLDNVGSRSSRVAFIAALTDRLGDEFNTTITAIKDAISNVSKGSEFNTIDFTRNIEIEGLNRLLNLFFLKKEDSKLKVLPSDSEDHFNLDRDLENYIYTTSSSNNFENGLVSVESYKIHVEFNELLPESIFQIDVNISDDISFASSILEYLSFRLSEYVEIGEYVEEFVSSIIDLIDEIIDSEIFAFSEEINVYSESNIDNKEARFPFQLIDKEAELEPSFQLTDKENELQLPFRLTDKESELEPSFRLTNKESELESSFQPIEGESSNFIDVIGGQNEIIVSDYKTSITIYNFGGIGKGIYPISEVLEELDVIKFEGEEFSRENILFQQKDDDLIILFQGLNEFSLVLNEFTLELIDNIPSQNSRADSIGNILFHNEQQLSDSFDVINSGIEVDEVFSADQVTFLNELNNLTYGFDSSDDIIHGLSGDDQLFGRSGRDRLYGEEGDDLLDGGRDDDLLSGGPGADKFVLSLDGSMDTIVDFTIGEDSLLLSEDLYLDDLRFYTLGALEKKSTLIKTSSTNETVAELIGIDSSLIDSSFFAFDI